jgi:hypothetical protein
MFDHGNAGIDALVFLRVVTGRDVETEFELPEVGL